MTYRVGQPPHGTSVPDAVWWAHGELARVGDAFALAERLFASSGTTVSGVKSITGGGDLSADRTLELVNDDAAPPADYVYGTNSLGVKGWVPAGSGGGGGGIGEAPADGQDYWRNTGAWVAGNWTSLDGKPSAFPPSAHAHAISDVSGLQTALDGKSDIGHTHDHGTLIGLSDDDHPQYHTDARGDARYAPLSHVGQGTGSHPTFAGAATVGFVPDPLTALGYVLADSGQWVPRAQGATGGVVLNYRYDDSTVAADPGSGDLRMNNANQDLATALYVSETSAPGNDLSAVWDTLRAGDLLQIDDTQGATGTHVYLITGAITDNGTWRTVPVTLYTSSGAAISNNNTIQIGVIYDPTERLPAGGTTGQVLAKTSSTNYATAWTATVPAWTVNAGDLIVDRSASTNNAVLILNALVTNISAVQHLVSGVRRAQTYFNAPNSRWEAQVYDAAGANGQRLVQGVHDGAAALFYAGVEKLATEASGAKVTGRLFVEQSGTDDALLVHDAVSDTTPFVINSAGRAVFGHPTPVAGYRSATGQSITPYRQQQGASAQEACDVITVWPSGSSAGAALVGARSNSGVVGTHAAVAAGNNLFDLVANGSDGSAFAVAATQRARVSAGTSVSAGVVPGTWVWALADTAGTLAEKLFLDHTGLLALHGTLSVSAGASVYSLDPATYGVELLNRAHGYYTFTADIYSTTFDYLKSRSATIGQHAAVQANDLIATLRGRGSDGTQWVSAAQMLMRAIGTISAGIVPGQIELQAADGAGTMATRLTVNASGTDVAGHLTANSIGTDVQYQSIAEGGNYTINNDTGTFQGTQTTTRSAATITMPAAPYAGQIVRIASAGAITALSHLPNAGQTLNGALTTIAANGAHAWQYRGTGIWYKV